MFKNIFSAIMIAFMLLTVYIFINNKPLDESSLENLETFENNNIPQNNFTKQFHNEHSQDEKKLCKLVKTYEKITPCCGGYIKPWNIGFTFDC